MHKRALGLAVTVIVGAVLVSASGAATAQTEKVTKIDVSTRAAVVHYLHSIHVNPKGAVIQRGARNYAGARCPGSGWTCASTKHTVVQIAQRGGQNRFVCRSSHCAVVQISGTSRGVYSSGRQLTSTAAPTKGGGGSTAACVKTGSAATTGSGQSCTISQSGSGPNMAVVYENSLKMSGLTASAAYTAVITQQVTSGNAGNTACVTQNINFDGSTTGTKSKPVTVTLEAHQSVTIKQDVASSGTNNAVNGATQSGTTAVCDLTPTDANYTLGQSQTLTSTANGSAAITQNENDQSSPCGDGVPGDNANMCLDIEQNTTGIGIGSATGPNNATFTQTNGLSAVANSPAGAISQTQSSSGGGLVGTVNQYSAGVSTATSTQTETQCEDAAKSGLTSCDTADPDWTDAPSSLTQNQYGPVKKGLGTATQSGGNPRDMFTINQTSTQNTDQGSDSNQQNNLEADCVTSGTCTVNQTTVINGNKTGPVTNSGQDLSNITINCTGSQCTQNPPPGPICNAGTGNTGAAYNAIPTDFAHCGPSSEGFEATATNEFGDEVTLDTTGGSNLTSMAVDFQSYGCGTSGHWYSGDCVTNPGDTFTIPGGITATVYSVGPNDTVGSPLATSTINPQIPYRPSADNTHCTGDNAGKWFDSVANACRNSYSALITFDKNWTFPNGYPTFTNGEKVIWTVQFNTSDAGYYPIGQDTTCFTSAPGCGYDSLNVGTQSYSNAPYAGTDVNEDVAFRSYDNGGYGGTLVPLQSETGWTGHRPLGEIVLGPPQTLSFSASIDDAAADWECATGGPIGLKVGSMPYNPQTGIGTNATIQLDNVGRVAISTLSEPTFATDNYNAGSPRYYITLNDGHTLWGYPPPHTGLTTSSNLAWAIDNAGNGESWGDVQSSEGSARVIAAFVIADGDQSDGTIDTITNLTFNNFQYQSFSSCIG